MARFVEGLSRFFGRVEIFALGLDQERIDAEAALVRDRPLEAREHARTLVQRVPESPLALALWADAAEDAWLDHEAVHALSELARKVPWRADVWYRLGQAGARTGWPHFRDALEWAAGAPDERDFGRLALLELSDIDLRAGDWARAQRWLDRIAASLSGIVDVAVALRRAEAALLRGDLDAARAATELLGPARDDAAGDGRRAALRARLAAAAGETEVAIDAALRAFILDEPTGTDVLTSIVAANRDVVVVDRIRRVVDAAGALEEPVWAAAFAFAEGRRDDARAALARGLGQGDRRAAASLLGLATETRDLDALDVLAARDLTLLPEALATLRDAALLDREGKAREALDRLDDVRGDGITWATEIRRAIATRWVTSTPPAWTELLAELRRTARFVDRLDLVSAIEALAVERERPLRVAVVGEFNAGKSTFLNALLGEDVAPTGVLPTTATLHWVAWAQDPFARILVRGAPDRVVQHAELKATLLELREEGAKVERVLIYAPIERLKRIEILDTPGFNAPDPEHLAAARAAFDEAHVAIWLVDVNGPLKDTERRVLQQIKELGVPVQILANKADRLKPEALAEVMRHVREGLAAAEITSYVEPLAFSARLSLKGKLGDAEALRASNWAAVEQLIAEKIVDASDALRERAVRRKSARLAAELADVALSRATADRERIVAARGKSDALRAASAKLLAERAAVAAALQESLEGARKLLAADLRPLGAVPEERQRADSGLREYLRDRFVARLAQPIGDELGKRAAVPAPPRALDAVRSVLLGAVASHDAPAQLLDKPLDRVLEACVEVFASALVGEAERSSIEAPSAAVSERARAIDLALRG